MQKYAYNFVYDNVCCTKFMLTQQLHCHTIKNKLFGQRHMRYFACNVVQNPSNSLGLQF